MKKNLNQNTEDILKVKTTTKGVDSLLGNPKKALVRLAIPNTIALFVTVIYQISDVIWVSGLGADALAIIGYILPFIFLINAIGAGIGTGGGTLIAQFIGSKKKEQADKTAAHSFVFIIIISIPVAILFLFFLKPIFQFMGADRLLNTTYKLGLLYIPFIFLSIFNQASLSILQAEGDGKRSMIGNIFGLILNIILDPLLIYVFRLGVYGIAVAAIISSAATSLLIFFWFFLKKNTYVACYLKSFKFDKNISNALIKRGLPVTLSQLSSTLLIFALTSIISISAGTDGVAVYSTGMRFITYILLPTYGIPFALTTVAAAALGTGSYEKLRISFYYTLKISAIITMAMAIATSVFAGPISSIFTWSKGSSRIAPDLITFLRIYAWYFPAISVWSSCICFFIGVGYSIFDFLFNFIKHLFYTIPLSFLFAIILKLGLPSIWSTVVIGMWIHSVIAFILLRSFLNRYKKTGSFAL